MVAILGGQGRGLVQYPVKNLARPLKVSSSPGTSRIGAKPGELGWLDDGGWLMLRYVADM